MMQSVLTGGCFCGSIKYIVPNKPNEIACCHCTICRKLHNKPFSKFAKYQLNDVVFEYDDFKNLDSLLSSSKAHRGFCKKCKTFLYMKYNNSNNIWFYVDTFFFDVTSIESYDIYVDTRV